MYVEYDKYDRLFLGLFCLMIRRPTRSTRPDTLFPLPPLVLSGVAGAGLATSLSIASGVAMMAWYFARLENYVAIDRRQLRPQWTQWRRIFRIGLPPGGEFALMFVYMGVIRSEEHTSELQSLMRISYAVFCLKKKKKKQQNI